MTDVSTRICAYHLEKSWLRPWSCLITCCERHWWDPSHSNIRIPVKGPPTAITCCKGRLDTSSAPSNHIGTKLHILWIPWAMVPQLLTWVLAVGIFYQQVCNKLVKDEDFSYKWHTASLRTHILKNDNNTQLTVSGGSPPSLSLFIAGKPLLI